MNEVVAAIIGALAVAAIAYVALRYRAKIGCELTYFTAEANEASGILVSPSASKHICLTRVQIVNVGLKPLNNVVLHLDHTKEVFSTSATASSLSANAVLVNPASDYVVIEIAEFPVGERVDVIVAQCGWPAMPGRRIRGAGGSYKVVDLRRHEFFTRAIGDLGWIFAALVAGILIGISAHA